MNARTVQTRLMRNRMHQPAERACLTVAVPLALLPNTSELQDGQDHRDWFIRHGHDAMCDEDQFWAVLGELYHAYGYAKGGAVFVCNGRLCITYNVKWFRCRSKRRFCACIAKACVHACLCGSYIRVCKSPIHAPCNHESIAFLTQDP